MNITSFFFFVAFIWQAIGISVVPGLSETKIDRIAFGSCNEYHSEWFYLKNELLGRSTHLEIHSRVWSRFMDLAWRCCLQRQSGEVFVVLFSFVSASLHILTHRLLMSWNKDMMLKRTIQNIKSWMPRHPWLAFGMITVKFGHALTEQFRLWHQWRWYEIRRQGYKPTTFPRLPWWAWWFTKTIAKGIAGILEFWKARPKDKSTICWGPTHRSRSFCWTHDTSRPLLIQPSQILEISSVNLSGNGLNQRWIVEMLTCTSLDLEFRSWHSTNLCRKNGEIIPCLEQGTIWHTQLSWLDQIVGDHPEIWCKECSHDLWRYSLCRNSFERMSGNGIWPGRDYIEWNDTFMRHTSSEIPMSLLFVNSSEERLHGIPIRRIELGITRNWLAWIASHRQSRH